MVDRSRDGLTPTQEIQAALSFSGRLDGRLGVLGSSLRTGSR
jgi:hypothetical protein